MITLYIILENNIHHHKDTRFCPILHPYVEFYEHYSSEKAIITINPFHGCTARTNGKILQATQTRPSTHCLYCKDLGLASL